MSIGCSQVASKARPHRAFGCSIVAGEEEDAPAADVAWIPPNTSAPHVLAAFTSRAPGTSWDTISLDVTPPSGTGSRLGSSTAFVASMTIWPDHDSSASASWMLTQGTASATIEQRAAS